MSDSKGGRALVIYIFTTALIGIAALGWLIWG